MSSEGCRSRSLLSSGNSERKVVILIILSTKKFENFSHIVLSDSFSGKEGAGNL